MDAYYKDTDVVSVDEFFSVEILRIRMYLICIAFVIPIAMYMWLYKYLVMFEDAGDPEFAFCIRLMLFLAIAFLIIFFWEVVGKKIEITGNAISITKWFFIHEDISIKDVTKCEVITGLTSYNRYHTTHYNKIVIHYGDKKKISVIDISYSNWNKLARYMEYKGKASFIDGRGFLSRLLDKD